MKINGMINQKALLNDVFDELYNEFKDDIRNDKDLYYNAYVFKQPPETPVLPHIQIIHHAVPIDENLDKGEGKWRIGLEVHVFAQDLPNYERRVIVRDLSEKVVDFFYHEYGFDLTFDGETPNLDTRILRHTMRFRAVYDLNTGIIYRK